MTKSEAFNLGLCLQSEGAGVTHMSHTCPLLRTIYFPTAPFST